MTEEQQTVMYAMVGEALQSKGVNISDNDTKYNIDNSDFFQTNNDVFGSSKPILSLNKSSYLVLPKTAVFEDTQSTITYDVDNEEQIAKIDYSYNGEYVGSASVDIAVSTVQSYNFDSIDQTAIEEQNKDPQENTIFVNIKKVLLGIIFVAGLLILLFVIKSFIQNYSFSRRRRSRLKRRKRHRDRMRTQFKDYDF